METAQIIRCPTCGAKNRVDPHRSGRPICGRCKTPLDIPAVPLVVTDETFTAEVEHSALPVVVDLWAPWCGPCRIIAPIIDELASEMSGQVRFARLNTDENQRTAARFNINGIPALLFFKDGREIDRIVGVHPKAEIARRLQSMIAQQ